jgi:carboxypeptidase family protein
MVPAHAPAQIVRGNVRERASGIPISGALITLARVAGTDPSDTREVASVLSDDAGGYAVRAPAPGHYRVTAKRIGVRRFTSDAFDLADGETKRVDIQFDAVQYRLPEVVVSGNAFCVQRRNEAGRIASLWDEARTALTATRISFRDRLFRGRITRYVRELDPRTLRVHSDQRRQTEGVVDRPFVSLSGDSLSKVGYWRSLPSGETEYNAPDQDVLLSEAFLRDHCFSVVDGGREHPGFLGLGFTPVARRELPDVRGTIWVDARTFELRFVEFRYTGIDPVPNANRVGGEVHFARLPSGAWIVEHWFIRIPRYTVYLSTATGLDVRRASSFQSPAITRLVEEGGDVIAEGLHPVNALVALTGIVFDSGGGSLAGASVHLAGTAFGAPVDSAGRFHMDGIPPGIYHFEVEHPGYRALGLLVADSTVPLAPGGATEVSFRAPNTDAVVAHLCEGRKPVARLGTLRVILLDSATSAPLGGVRLQLAWKEFSGGYGSIQVQPHEIVEKTDVGGATTFCALPADRNLELGIWLDQDHVRRIAVVKMLENELVARVIRATLPR